LDFYPVCDVFIGISNFHKKDHILRYGNIAEKMIVMDIPNEEDEYNKPIPKKLNKVIYCSVPDRGLGVLLNYWPKIKKELPDLKLVVTSDYRLWGNQYPMNDVYRNISKNLPDIEFLGKIPRKDLIKEQLESEAQLYPCIYDENFCISTSECQMAGNFCITSSKGALETTNQTDGKISGNPYDSDFEEKFINKVVEYFNKPAMERMEIQNQIRKKAFERFSWGKNIEKWLELING